ncbi:MAG: SDR family NAD(P)-dependent oxidoreductase [Mycobacterium sp.]
MSKVWFITGSSRGFGRELVRAALETGDAVVATARRPEQLGDLATTYGERILALPLDVTDAAAAAVSIAAAQERFGRLDVVVNNAGYANVAPIETGDDEDFRAQFETNFWGVYNVSKAAIPALREQGGGLIIQFSSMGGRVGGSAGIASYQAAKFAIDGFSRVLQTETAPFGIKVLVVEPSGFATDWAGSSMEVADIPDHYGDTVGAMNSVRDSDAITAGDPARAAEILLRMARRTDLPYHLPLGVTAVEGSIRQDEFLLAEDGLMPALLAHWQGVRERRGATAPEHAPGVPLVFHPPCTLQHGQQLRGGVEQMLSALDFDVRLAATESHLCCGSAGTYSVLQPVIATQLRDRKLAALAVAQPEPRAIVSANIGCISHLQSGTATPVRHWIELVDERLAG